jgi:hypothetical protein
VRYWFLRRRWTIAITIVAIVFTVACWWVVLALLS